MKLQIPTMFFILFIAVEQYFPNYFRILANMTIFALVTVVFNMFLSIKEDKKRIQELERALKDEILKIKI